MAHSTGCRVAYVYTSEGDNLWKDVTTLLHSAWLGSLLDHMNFYPMFLIRLKRNGEMGGKKEGNNKKEGLNAFILNRKEILKNYGVSKLGLKPG